MNLSVSIYADLLRQHYVMLFYCIIWFKCLLKYKSFQGQGFFKKTIEYIACGSIIRILKFVSQKINRLLGCLLLELCQYIFIFSTKIWHTTDFSADPNLCEYYRTEKTIIMVIFSNHCNGALLN